MSGGIGLLIIIAFVALILLWFVFYFIPIGLWFSALVSGVRISLLQLVLMRFRKVPPSVIVNQLSPGRRPVCICRPMISKPTFSRAGMCRMW